MNQNIIKLLKFSEQKDFDSFVLSTSGLSDALINKKSQTIDLSWIDKVEETLPALDAIIRNPRRFLKEEEEVVIVEKTKKVTQETVKHLAQHSSLIQDIDESGDVHPKKLLNVYKEETFSIYENRFVYTLIKNLYNFISSQMFVTDYKEYNKESKDINYKGQTVINGDNVEFNLSYNSKKELEGNKSQAELDNLKLRFDRILQEVDGFSKSAFMKNLVNVSPVKSPIRRTNAIRKDNNLKKCLELWEELEKYQLTDPVKKEDKTINEVPTNLKNGLDFINYVSYNIINDLDNVEDNSNELFIIIKKLIKEYIYNNDDDYDKLKNIILKEFKEAIKEKQDIEKAIKKCFDNYFSIINRSKAKAIKYL